MKADFPDEICRNSYYLDVHYTLEEAKLAAVGKIDGEKRDARYGPGESHGIPYRALLPQGVKNVIVAGVAAAFAANANGDVHAVDTDKLRETLRENGAYFH